VAAFAVDTVAGVFIDGVISSQGNRTSGNEVSEDPASQAAAQVEKGPAAAGEEAVIAGRVARGQHTDGAQDVGDGVAANGQDGGDQQDGKAEKGRAAEGWREGLEAGLGLLGQVLIVAEQTEAGLTCLAGLAGPQLTAFALGQAIPSLRR
jgi:hypothetical protein